MTPQPPITPPSPAEASPLEAIPCPLCGGDTTGRRSYDFAPHRVVRCTGCGLWYLSPRLDEQAMRASYREDSYFEGEGPGYRSYQSQETTLRRTFRRFLGALEARRMTGGDLLEVGCAYGYFLDEAAPWFERRVGTEFSARAAERARRRGDRVLLGGLEALAGERFDVAAVIHVIEHVYDPVTFLTQLRGHLVPGGWAVVATPEMGGFWRPLMGRRWPFFKIPEHVTYFDRQSLQRLFEAAGYREAQPVPYVSSFSLQMIAEKLGRSAPTALASRALPLPATTLAMAARAPRSG
ncbi:MAG TPA: methyltransferase domain-containing protein [Thermoanaerobaculia bacterium]|nr:methyltransferase domain-containing protein [Thermoanaerobaculia bacterium]